MKKKKICVVVASRANYGRVKSLLVEIKKNKKLELQLILSASAILKRFGNVLDIVKKDGFKPNSIVYTVVEGENLETMSKSTGLAIVELTTCFSKLNPDIVVTVADRYETMATAIAASYMNITLAHIQGGEVTGSIDESVRHSITKLAHIHFPATQESKKRIIKMGENKKYVFNTGCPSIDLIKKTPKINNKHNIKENGVGIKINYSKPFILVVQHPVTSEYGEGFRQISETLRAIEKLNIQTIWLWPNIDAGSDEISKGLRVFRETKSDSLISFYKNFEIEDYAYILKNCICAVGNSSSFLREGEFFGTPVVLVGTRQNGREHGKNITKANYKTSDILIKIKKQIAHGKYNSKKIFGDGTAGKKIVNKLISSNPSIQKKITY